MAGTMVQISEKSSSLLDEIVQMTGDSVQSVLDRAIEGYRRQRLFEEANAAYAAMRADPDAWQAELQERAEWDATLLDGLETEPSFEEGHSDERTA